jgi:alpha-tubulin suppressor-like RCC1 family protein
VLKCK